MVKSALWIPRRDSADDDSLLAYAMKTRLIVAFLLMWFALPAHAVINTARVAKLYSNGNVYSYVGYCTGVSDKTACYAVFGLPNGSWPLNMIGVFEVSASCTAPAVLNPSTLACDSPPPPACEEKTGTQSPHLYADGAVVPSSSCDEGCVVTIEVGASNGSLWVGWGQYTGAACTGQVAASPAPSPTPDSCPAGKALQGGVCTPLVDIPALGYGGMSISDIQKAIAKSEAATASKKAAAEKLVTPVYTSPDSIENVPSIQNEDKKKAVEESGSGGRDSARDQGGSGDTQIISGELGAGFGSIVTTLKDIFGGNVAGASVNGAQIDLIVQPTTKEIAVTSLTPVAVAHAQAVCPSTNITLQGHPAVWTYTTECNFATSIRPILLAFAWLSATFILVGGIKNG